MVIEIKKMPENKQEDLLPHNEEYKLPFNVIYRLN